ncbi:MAG: 4Fe-4S binding protein [Limnochordia bacterium]|jgi:MinD superfamily P-loop ATPase
MKVAVLSGKGGTGKTLVAVNLAAVAGESTYIDCDVEEPNGHLFLKPKNIQEEAISIRIPKVDNNRCSGCRTCVEFCKFSALAYIKDSLLIFEELCHSCGGCILLCPEEALTEKERIIGRVQRGVSDQVRVHTGILNPGEAVGIPIIDELLADHDPTTDGDVFIDCPPGIACNVMESIKDVDYCLLVAEPTVFGLHNFRMVYQLVKLFQKPCGVVLNKCLDGENPAEEFCLEKEIRILGRIPFDGELGILNSKGEIAVRKREKYRRLFATLLGRIRGEVHHETTASS